jgi:mevalonate kinase
MANTGKDRKSIKRGAGKRSVDSKSLRLADEVRYIQRRAAGYDGRVITVGQLVLFSTETGDAWLLDPADQLATRLARDGDPEPVHIEETDTTFAIGWKGHYHIEGPAFIYLDGDTGRVSTILGYPTHQLK